MTRHPLSEVWHPRFQIVNQQRILTTFPEEVEVDAAGEVIYRQRVWGRFSQPLDLREFPFDSQTFEILLVSAGFTPEEVELVRDDELPSGLAPGFSVPDWEVGNAIVGARVYAPLAGSGASAFFLQIQAKRYTGYYLLKILLPLALVVLMSGAVLWIDPDTLASVQISVSVTSMLTLIAYRFMVVSTLPRVSYLTRIDLIILGSTLLVFATLIESICTSYLAKQGKPDLARAIDRRMRMVFGLAFVGIGVGSMTL